MCVCVHVCSCVCVYVCVCPHVRIRALYLQLSTGNSFVESKGYFNASFFVRIEDPRLRPNHLHHKAEYEGQTCVYMSQLTKLLSLASFIHFKLSSYCCFTMSGTVQQKKAAIFWASASTVYNAPWSVAQQCDQVLY